MLICRHSEYLQPLHAPDDFWFLFSGHAQFSPYRPPSQHLWHLSFLPYSLHPDTQHNNLFHGKNPTTHGFFPYPTDPIYSSGSILPYFSQVHQYPGYGLQVVFLHPPVQSLNRSVLYLPASDVLLSSYVQGTIEIAYFSPFLSIFFNICIFLQKSNFRKRCNPKPGFSYNIIFFDISDICITAVLTVIAVIS